MKRLLKHLFVPHHTNNFRPRILHVPVFLTYALFFIALNLSFRIIHTKYPDILGFATNITIDQLISLTNQERSNAGLAPLTYNQKLSEAAAGKAQDMFGEDYWAHNSPSGKTPWDFIVGSGYRYVYAGENLAKNFQDSNGVVTAWMASPSHRENILRSQYSEVGFAVVNGTLNGEETTLVVQMFGSPQQSAALKQTVQGETQHIEEQTQPAEEAQEITEAETPQVAGVPDNTQVAVLPQAGVISMPSIDGLSAFRTVTLVLSLIIMLTLVIDGIYIWRKKIVRISGRNLAHIMFLTAITGSIWLVSTGSIL